MPLIEVNGVNLFYQEKGTGKETIIFSHGLLWSHKMFQAQIDFFSQNYRVIAYDHRGQGQSEVKGPFDMETVAEDAAALIQKFCKEPIHFAGLSMGGFVGMRLASRHPELLKSLILLETSANAEPVENLPKYKTLNGVVKWLGVIPPVAKKVMHIMFAESWLTNPSNKLAIKHWKNELSSNKKSITGPVEGVIFRKGVEDELSKITCPTLIIVGDEDVATKPEKAKYIQMGIASAKLHVLTGAGHSSCIEKPDEVNRLILDWLTKSN
ncbi:alpha/beta fold hydrolase [Algoriphagus sp.]|jgi:pimeloyl-ACP methyl ester carboxylesterase|uniref:alpha/beta fold hydrolase n=1 Tax=Algoriphagus sp. TaxID=1872435 RepID=UPI00271DD7F2|nr:alpha/beta hydrolase [Algoriphagus sp.]MDO8968885.1 alpha/beta hydrolase [Algoriphagus sp.]MDP3201346.1 alpha/beta hydrolase [Algoriphagus sp.]